MEKNVEKFIFIDGFMEHDFGLDYDEFLNFLLLFSKSAAI